MKLVNEQITKNPNNPALYILQTDLFLRAKESDQALASITKAVELDKNSAAALVLLAQLQVEKGQTGQAIANYQHAIEDS